MLNNKAAYKYETPYNSSLDIMQMWNNYMVTLQMGATEIRYNILQTNTYKTEIDVDDVYLLLYIIYLFVYIYIYIYLYMLCKRYNNIIRN